VAECQEVPIFQDTRLLLGRALTVENSHRAVEGFVELGCFLFRVRWPVYLGTMISSTIAGSFTRGCAARDLQILMLIEERESAKTFPPEKLSDAMFTMLHARMVCHEGRVVDALAIYDNVAQSLTANPFVSDRR
jgi:hypothetical protein